MNADAVTTRWIDIADGGFQGFLALPPAGHGPGLVLYQEIFGVNAHIRAVAQQYALDGFVVLAPDVFWRQQKRVEYRYVDEDRALGREMASRLVPAQLEADLKAAVAALRSLPETRGRKVGAIGYCLGGRLAYLSAALAQVDAAVSNYGGGIQDRLDPAPRIACPLLLHYAENDAGIPLEAVERVRSGLGPRAEVHVYPGAAHGFNCWVRPVYDPRSAVTAHGRTLSFLAAHLYP